MAEVQQTNGHDKKAPPVTAKKPKRKRTGKWANREYVRAYNKKWYAKRRKKKEVVATVDSEGQIKVDEAVVYLRHAVKSINKRVADGYDETVADLLAKLALKTLKGEE